MVVEGEKVERERNDRCRMMTLHCHCPQPRVCLMAEHVQHYRHSNLMSLLAIQMWKEFLLVERTMTPGVEETKNETAYDVKQKNEKEEGEEIGVRMMMMMIWESGGIVLLRNDVKMKVMRMAMMILVMWMMVVIVMPTRPMTAVSDAAPLNDATVL